METKPGQEPGPGPCGPGPCGPGPCGHGPVDRSPVDRGLCPGLTWSELLVLDPERAGCGFRKSSVWRRRRRRSGLKRSPAAGGGSMESGGSGRRRRRQRLLGAGACVRVSAGVFAAVTESERIVPFLLLLSPQHLCRCCGSVT